MGLRLDGVNKVGELDGILNEKDGNIIPNNIPVTLLCVKFDCKPSNVADRVLRKSLRVNISKNDSIHTALPLAPWTVLNRTNTGVVCDESVSTGA